MRSLAPGPRRRVREGLRRLEEEKGDLKQFEPQRHRGTEKKKQ